MSKTINPTDNKFRYHGYQEWYHDGKLWHRGIMKHSNRIGYDENHTGLGETVFTIR